MSISTLIFYILAAVIVGGGLMAVTERKIFRSAVYLLFSLVGIAGLYFYLNYEFLAAVQIVVYVGGIVVLIIFSIFLTAESGQDMKGPGLIRLIFSSLACVIAFSLVYWLLSHHGFTGRNNPAVEASTRNIGRQMLSTSDFGYILPFEVVSILLLAAMIGCIVIALKLRTKT
ncbi:MAG TPA: NADH-quinone oxidoreductase subunit J [Bacteroidia bacterium]|nr:NADH-quinone oxidoreductase subunit J [Bacteroidia bacterium]